MPPGIRRAGSRRTRRRAPGGHALPERSPRPRCGPERACQQPAPACSARPEIGLREGPAFLSRKVTDRWPVVRPLRPADSARLRAVPLRQACSKQISQICTLAGLLELHPTIGPNGSPARTLAGQGCSSLANLRRTPLAPAHPSGWTCGSCSVACTPLMARAVLSALPWRCGRVGAGVLARRCRHHDKHGPLAACGLSDLGMGNCRPRRGPRSPVPLISGCAACGQLYKERA